MRISKKVPSQLKSSGCVGVPLYNKAHLRHEIYCALCGVARKVWVKSKSLNAKQHLQTVLFSVFLAWALFPLMGSASFYLYPFVWAATEMAKRALFRRGAQCHHCGFDAVLYKKDICKAKQLIKNHLEDMPKNTTFKNGYYPKNDTEEETIKNHFNL